MTPTQLRIAADLLEAQDEVRVRNLVEAGYWERMALAAESLTGFSSTANANVEGYMLRTALAFEDMFGGSGQEESATEPGYMKRIVDALEIEAGVSAGSLEQRFITALNSVSFDTDTDAPFTKVSADGDSNIADSAGTYGYFRRFLADNPGVTGQNFALAGATIHFDENNTNNLNGRISSIVAYGASDHFIHVGTNDLKTLTDVQFLAKLFAHVAALRTAGFTGRIWIVEIPPSTAADRPGVNLYRGTVNAALRAAVGVEIDGIVPLGTHPILGVDTYPNDTTAWNADKIHMIARSHYYAYQVFNDVMAPLIAGSTATSPPTLPLFDVKHAPLSTPVLSRARVTGMTIGQAAAVSRSGSGDFAVGTGAYGTSGTVMNGDVITARQTSSASNDDPVSQTITAGETSQLVTVRTQPSSYSSTTTMDPVNKYAPATLSNGNLTATGNGSVGACHPIRSTSARTPSDDPFYFEVTGAASLSYMACMDSTVPLNAPRLPGQSAGYTNAGMAMAVGGSVVVYNKGASLTLQDFIAFGTITAGSVVGMAIWPSAGRFWVRGPGGWIHGNPEMRDGGFTLNAPLAQYWCFAGPRIAEATTINYGASAFAYAVPVGFKPHL